MLRYVFSCLTLAGAGWIVLINKYLEIRGLEGEAQKLGWETMLRVYKELNPSTLSETSVAVALIVIGAFGAAVFFVLSHESQGLWRFLRHGNDAVCMVGGALMGGVAVIALAVLLGTDIGDLVPVGVPIALLVLLVGAFIFCFGQYLERKKERRRAEKEVRI